MNPANAKTIQIFLPTGEPRGIRIAELTTRVVQAVLIPRSDLADAKSRSELDQVAVYFLFGGSEDQAKPIVYIGQTEDVRKRLDNHNSNKEFWRTAVLGISKTQSFTQAHIRWLEWYCMAKAREINRFSLDNGSTPSEPFTTEPMKADLLDAFDTLSPLLSTLGYPIFEPVSKPASTEFYYLRAKGTDARGRYVEDGFLVMAGSLGRKDIVQSARQTVSSLRAKLSDSGVIVDEGDHIRFVEDYLFDTPSGAAVTALGRSANGWIEWKTDDGKTLSEMKRGPIAESQATDQW